MGVWLSLTLRKSQYPMKYNNKEKFANYLDLFILFIELDIFIWVLFELGHTLRPFVYQVGRILIILYIFELLFQFIMEPRFKIYIRKQLRNLVSLCILIFLFNRFVFGLNVTTVK